MTSSDAWDVIVLGSGVAGLAGALAGHELGLRPIVLEKARTLGGGTINSYGLIWIGQNHLAQAAGYSDTRDETIAPHGGGVARCPRHHRQPRNRAAVGAQIRPAVRQSDPSPPSSGWRQVASDEVVLKISGVRHWLWRAVDQTGTVLDVLVQRRRDKQAAKRLLRKLLKKQMRPPRVMITDKLASYGAAKREVMPGVEHRQHKGLNNRAPRIRTSRRVDESGK
jgi:IS1 family transposase